MTAAWCAPETTSTSPRATWEATGEEELVVHVVVKGEVEYLGPHHSVVQRITTADRIQDYRRHCATVGVQPRELS